MTKKTIYTIIIAGFGALLIVTAALIFSINRTAFGVLLAIGFLALLVGIVELIRVRRGGGTKEQGFFRGSGGEPPKYRKKQMLLSKPEKQFFNFLRNFLSSEHFEIFAQLPLVSIIGKETQNSFRNELFRVVDFCIADARSTEPLLLIEINDASHNRSDRIERDKKVKEICDSAKIRLIQFALEDIADEKYCASVLRKYL